MKKSYIGNLLGNIIGGGDVTKQYRYIVFYVYIKYIYCLLYTSDAADDTPCVDLGGRRIIKKNK